LIYPSINIIRSQSISRNRKKLTSEATALLFLMDLSAVYWLTSSWVISLVAATVFSPVTLLFSLLWLVNSVFFLLLVPFVSSSLTALFIAFFFVFLY